MAILRRASEQQPRNPLIGRVFRPLYPAAAAEAAAAAAVLIDPPAAAFYLFLFRLADDTSFACHDFAGHERCHGDPRASRVQVAILPTAVPRIVRNGSIATSRQLEAIETRLGSAVD